MKPSERIRQFWGLAVRYGLGAAATAALLLAFLVIGAICIHDGLDWIGKPFPGFLLNERLAIAPLDQHGWTVTAKGVAYPDKILAADGVPAHSAARVLDVVAARPIGTPITYTVQHGDRMLEVQIATMRFTAADLLATFGSHFIVGLCYLFVGLAVMVLKFNTKVGWVFFAACMLQALYNVTAFDLESAHRFARVHMLAVGFYPAVFVHFAMLFPRKWAWAERHPLVTLAPYLLSAGLEAPILYLYPDDRMLGPWKVLLLYVAIGALAILVPVVAELVRQTSVIARQRAKVLMVGALLAFPLPAAAWLSQVYVGSFLGVRVPTNLLPVPMFVFPAAVAYSIIRHNLFDVDVYLKRALGYAIMVAVLALGYFGIETATMTLVLEPVFGAAAQKAYPVGFALLVVLFYNPIASRVHGMVERLFFRSKADYKGTVLAVGEALSSLLDAREITRRIVQALRGEMFLDTAGVITLDPRTMNCHHFFVEERFEDRGRPREREGDSLCDDPLFAALKREKRMVTKYDIDEDPRFADIKEACAPRFTDLGVSVLIPLTAQGELTGALAVGYKKSGKYYTREDIDLLTTLAHEGAVALENARLVQDMKKEELVRTNLSRYLSPQIVEQVVHRNVTLNLGGDRKEVTVLFSDIRNFTSITETRPADQLVQILNSYFTEMAQIIFANNGSLDKYIGDAIVAVFGSLIEVERPVENAVQAAVQMMQRMPELNASWLQTYGFSMEMGIGVTTGEVFLGNIGSPERMEFTVIGDTVNVASRLSGLARGGQILLTRPAMQQLGNGFICNPLPPARVKGKAEPLEVFEVAF